MALSLLKLAASLLSYGQKNRPDNEKVVTKCSVSNFGYPKEYLKGIEIIEHFLKLSGPFHSSLMPILVAAFHFKFWD
jgi:hypothetical protein